MWISIVSIVVTIVSIVYIYCGTSYLLYKMSCSFLSMLLMVVFNAFVSQARTDDVIQLIILTEKNDVQNPFVTAVMQGLSLVQTNNNGLTFNHISIVLDR